MPPFKVVEASTPRSESHPLVSEGAARDDDVSSLRAAAETAGAALPTVSDLFGLSKVEAKEMEATKFPLPCDVYGLLFLRLTELASRFDPVEGKPHRAPILHFVSALVLYILYFLLSSGVTIFLLIVVADSQRIWGRRHFMDSHGMDMLSAAELLRENIGTNTTADHHPHVSDALFATCQELSAVPRVYIYKLMVFLWATRMAMEFKSARDWAMNLYQLESRSMRDVPLMRKIGDNSHILRSERWIKLFCIPTILLQKMVTFALVLHIGSCFLMLQNNGFAIVVKVIAMQIVLGIDEQIVDSLALRKAHNMLTHTSFLFGSHETGFLRRIYWYDGVGSMIFVFLVSLVTYFYVIVKFGALNELREACRMYMSDGTALKFWDLSMVLQDLEL